MKGQFVLLNEARAEGKAVAVGIARLIGATVSIVLKLYVLTIFPY